MFPFGFWPLAFVCWVPVLLVARGMPGWKRAALLASSLVVATGLGFHFVPEALVQMKGMSTWAAHVLVFLLAVVQSLHMAAVGFLLPRGRAGLFAFPFLGAAAESFVMGPFPWSQANLLQNSPVTSQLAAYGGAMTLTFILLTINALLAVSFIQRKLVLLASALAICASIAGFGSARISSNQCEDDEILTVGVVQTAELSTSGETGSIEELRQTSIQLLEQNKQIDLLVWPEGEETRPLQLQQVQKRAVDFWFQDRRQSLPRSQVTIPVLLGALVARDSGELENAALLVDPLGRLKGSYAKRRLVPVGETPLDLGSFSMSAIYDFSAGTGPADISIRGLRLLVLICVEDLYPALVEEDSDARLPHVLITLASNGWFKGREAGELHFELSKLRAIETGRPLLRVVNYGVSALIDPYGRTLARLPAATSDSKVWNVPICCGNVVSMARVRPVLATLVVLLALLWSWLTG